MMKINIFSEEEITALKKVVSKYIISAESMSLATLFVKKDINSRGLEDKEKERSLSLIKDKKDKEARILKGILIKILDPIESISVTSSLIEEESNHE